MRWCPCVRAGGPADRVPLTVVRSTFPSGREAYQSRLVLVRLNQYVAWTGDEAPADAQAVLRTARSYPRCSPARASRYRTASPVWTTEAYFRLRSNRLTLCERRLRSNVASSTTATPNPCE
jgi:hypothetical protein